ncbi:hypothetical protein [Buttiauxella gaviniae]|uniref:hypothetical protein n=1 Tax=Buttiauxella gaviniae TaxID=82990 RepID=UPI0039B0627C
MNVSRAIKMVFLIQILMVAGCATHQITVVDSSGPGFLMGVLDGWIAPFAFIGHLFDNAIAVYAIQNVGTWYDFGFLLGVGALSSWYCFLLSLFSD